MRHQARLTVITVLVCLGQPARAKENPAPSIPATDVDAPAYSTKADAAVQKHIDALLSGEGILGSRMPISYESSVQLALERNLGYLSSRYDLAVARARYDEAEAARNPTVSNDFSYLHQDQNLQAATLTSTRFLLLSLGYGVSQSQLYTLGQNQMLNRTTLYVPVYTGGRLESAMHVQAALAAAQKYGLERTRQQIIYTIKQQYLDSLVAHENRQVARQVLHQAEETQAYARSRLNVGVGTIYDVLQAEVAVANAQDAVVKTQTAWERANADLAGILDLPVLTHFEFGDSLSSGDILRKEAVPPLEMQGLAKLALGRRPELEALRHELVANKERENVARSGMKPQLGMSLNYDVLGNPNNLYGGFSMIAQLAIPIFDGGVSRTEVKEFQLRNLQLKEHEIELINNITLEVRSALLALQEADARMPKVEAAEKAARENVRISALRFQVGAGTSLELVIAQTVLANAQFVLADARYQQLLTRAALNFAVGDIERVPVVPPAAPLKGGPPGPPLPR